MSFVGTWKRRSRQPLNTLICHYCNQPDDRTVQSGSTRQWECNNCTSTNYYDEDGEIADPPISIVNGNSDARYAYSRSTHGRTQKPLTDHPFCQTCLKNQHLYTSSLAQYHLTPHDTDELEDNEQIREEIRQLESRLQDRYPQVCSACEAGVIARIKHGHYIAQTDNLGRVLQRLRKRDAIEPHPSSDLSPWILGEVFYALGRFLWWLAILLQFLWSSLYLFQTGIKFFSDCDFGSSIQCQNNHYHQANASLWFSNLIPLAEVGYSLIPLIARSSTIIGGMTLLWNPQYKPGSVIRSKRAKDWHHKWFKLQAGYLCGRITLWCLGTHGVSFVGTSTTAILHILILVFTFNIAIAARHGLGTKFRQSLRITKGSSPRGVKTSPIGRGFGSLKSEHLPKYSSGRNTYGLSLEDDQIASELKGLEDEDYKVPPSPEESVMTVQNPWREEIYTGPSNSDSPSSLHKLSNLSLGQSPCPKKPQINTPPISEKPHKLERFMSRMTEAQGHQWLETGHLPDHMLDEMDWESNTTDYTFNAPRKPAAGPFAHTSLTPLPQDPSPFRKPVPPLPQSWVQRAYNSSTGQPELKLDQRDNPFLTRSDTRTMALDRQPEYPEMARQSFFYEPDDLPVNGLADKINKFGLGSTGTSDQHAQLNTYPQNAEERQKEEQAGNEQKNGISTNAWRVLLQLVVILITAQLLAWARHEVSWQFWTSVMLLIGFMAHYEMSSWR